MIHISNSFRQRGQVILILLAILGLGAAAVYFTYASPASQHVELDKATNAALAQAREALIGRAAAAADRPGSLPCPDTDNDGEENLTGSACTSYIGRLPWKALGLPLPG